MGDHGGGQEELGLAAKELDKDWGEKGVHVYYVPDLYYKEKDQMKAYLAERRIPYDAHDKDQSLVWKAIRPGHRQNSARCSYRGKLIMP